jgi:hypothetical protein
MSFSKILIANRGDNDRAAGVAAQPERVMRVAAQPERVMRVAHAGDFPAG